ncbi:MAG TPA: tetratricopeptide repeat protein [Candidatus Eisenbacteria bacterium]
MRQRLTAALFLIAVVVTPALASMGGSPPPEPSPSQPPEERDALTPRQQAEQLYGGAYDDIAKANVDAANGKTKNAEKKFKRALDRASGAVELDSTYFEAWNLVGYAARKLGDYPRSLAAYDRCLRIQPGYAPAREYLGEAYVELGRVREAREQLAWLDRLGAADQSKLLSQRIADWQSAHPDSLAPSPAARPAGADSTRAPATGSGN